MHYSLFAFILAISLSSVLSSTQNQRLLATTTYVTTAQRGPTVTNRCNDKINRQKLYENYGLTGDIPHGQSVSNAFNLDTTFIDDAVGGNWTEFGNKIKGIAGKIFVFVGAWVIGLAILIILLPFLLCCCACPWVCPVFGRTKQKMPYTKCQLIWPAVVSIILLLTILIVSIIGISSKFKAKTNYDQVACSSGIVIDDVTNGNVTFTNSNVYFSGVRTIDTQLRDMNSKINQLNVEVAKLGTASTGVTDAKSKITAAKTSTGQVPSVSESSINLAYNTPIQNTPGTTTSTITSIFNSILGNKSTTASLVGAAYTTLTTYESALSTISSAADTYISNIASYTTSINQALNQTNRYATDLQSQDSKINDFWSKGSGAFNGSTVGQYVFYGILIGLSVLMILAIACTVWGMSSKCRYFMYGICGILFFFCLVAFLYCIFISILNPMVYYSCQYVQQNLNSKAKLTSTLTNRLKIDATISGNVSQCIAVDGNGNLAQNVLGSQVYNTITSLNTTYTNLVNIDVSLGNYINLTHTILLNNITAYKKAQILDFNDGDSLNQLIKLAQASNYGCNTPGFNSDSWIPSISQNQSAYVPCKVTNAANSDSSTCTNSVNFNTRASGCTGCMDTYDLFKGNTTYTNVNLALSSRYPDASCTTFNSQLSNVWGNFYKQKVDILGPAQTRASTAKTNSDAVVSTISYFAQVKQNIDSNFSSIVDSQYGLLKGINCQVASQDVKLMKNVVCQGLFLYTYFTRIIFGILSFALLFLMCCITCTGHRNCKQMQFKPMNEYKDQAQPFSPQNNLHSQQQFNYGQYNPYANQNNQVNPYVAPNNQYPKYTLNYV